MAKTTEHNKALVLRRNGKSIKDIAKKLHVSKSTVCLWCSGIELTSEQIENLHDKMVRGSYVGRMKGAQFQHDSRIKRVKAAEDSAIEAIGKLSNRDLLIAFTALYWGEGSKSQRVFFISNSDPDMIKFILIIYEKIFKITKERIILSVGLNILHKYREAEIKNYWSEITGIPTNQFRKTIFIKAKNKKNYKNANSHYGTLRINIKKSVSNYYIVMGLIKALANGIYKPA